MSSSVYTPPSTDIEIIHVDETLLVANKPSGLLAVPGRGPDKQDCLIKRIQVCYPDAQVVHRLDMSTSGLMLFARGEKIQRHLSQMFRERLVGKRYVAIVAGKLNPVFGEIDLPIAADWLNRPINKVNFLVGKPSLTRFRLLHSSATSSRLELEPVTGRTHQLRVHMAAIGHPILGDELYGDPTQAPCLQLHASKLRLLHPVTAQSLNFICNPLF